MQKAKSRSSTWKSTRKLADRKRRMEASLGSREEARKRRKSGMRGEEKKTDPILETKKEYSIYFSNFYESMNQ